MSQKQLVLVVPERQERMSPERYEPKIYICRKYTRSNQRVLQGNNRTGRIGKLRCDTCRKRHSKVTSILLLSHTNTDSVVHFHLN